MKYKTILEKLNNTFLNDWRPARVTKCAAGKDMDIDSECQSIEDDFANRDRESLSYKECSMMIIDSALITDEAFTYFIPRLARAVIDESGDSFMLRNRLKTIGNMNKEKMALINDLILICDELESELESDV